MDNNPFSLDGHHVLVTGASSGIGRAIATESARMGARVTLLGRDEKRLAASLGALPGFGHHAVQFDLSDAVGITNLISSLENVDGVVHAAGITRMAPAKFITQADFNEIMAVNVYAAMELTKQLLQHKKINKAASLVFISSVAGGILPSSGQGVYAASKGALSAYAKVLAVELMPRRIRVNSILPAMVRTPLLAKMDIDADTLASDEKKYPLGYGAPEDVAWAAVYLLSKASRWMTGNNLVIDGGVTLT
jgi:NAD(P)-dependent dehydrogenase (short-subunit alcohol dehydrogenase family)